MGKVLYLAGLHEDNVKVIENIVNSIGHELEIFKYDIEYPDDELDRIESYIDKNEIKYVIGNSIGAFLTLCLSSNVKKVVINPMIKPHIDLTNFVKVSNKSLYDYEYLEKWLVSGDDTPWVSQIDEVMGLFGDHNELFNYYESFKKLYPRAYYINADHRPTKEAYTEDIKQKIKEFFS